MPNRIDTIFADLRSRSEKALMPFVCGGYPRPGDTAKVLPALERAGASIVEVGFPFSDPIADGPVIAAAMHEALKAGATPESVLDEIAAARRSTRLGIVAMISVSIVWRFGPEALIARAKTAGVDGFIFPDLIVEESEDLIRRVRDAGQTASLLVAPTTPPQRAERIAKACSGFVYLLARAGITGEHGTTDSASIASRVRMLRQATDLPIACGFGIATQHQVRQVVNDAGADAAIVGSALVRQMSDAAAKSRSPIEAAEGFVKNLARGLRTNAVSS